MREFPQETFLPLPSMAETLGSVCDKLTIVKPKEWHSEKQPERLRRLATQEQQLRDEIDA